MTKTKRGRAPEPDPFTKLLVKRNLAFREACFIFTELFKGGLSKQSAKALLLLLARKGESLDEISGCLAALRRLEPPHELNWKNLLDTCGTGGDQSGSINVSTLAALVIAGAGGRVAKHGNRGISSRCGSSDLMEALGVRLNASPKTMIRAIQKCGIGYFHAPHHHPIFSRVQPLRRELKTRTIFNLLGPLVNPVTLDHQLIGVSKKEHVRLYARLLARRGGVSALVCHGRDGMDEISVTAPTDIALIQKGKIRFQVIDPRKFGFKTQAKKNPSGGSVQKNKALALAILKGRLRGPLRDLVVMNAAAGLVVSGIASNFKEGILLSEHSIDSGRAYAALQKLITITRGQG